MHAATFATGDAPTRRERRYLPIGAMPAAPSDLDSTKRGRAETRELRRGQRRRGAQPQDERAAAASARAAAGLKPSSMEREEALPASLFADLDGTSGGTPLASFEYSGEARANLLAQYYARDHMVPLLPRRPVPSAH